MTFTTVSVTRDYDLANGVSPTGRVGFTPTTSMANAGKTVVAVTVWAVLDVDGKIAQSLQANTDPTTTPTGVSYLVTEQINNTVFNYYVRIPHDQGSTVDLSTLLIIPVITPPAVTYPAPGPQGPAGPTGATGPAGTLTDGSVTDVKVASAAAINADKLADGTTNKILTATERTKLTGVATGATANSSDATLLNRANHTGTQSADTLTDGTTNKAFLATERTKLAGIATGATNPPTDPVAGTAGLRTLGGGAQQATAGNDARLSDTRTPTAASVVNASVSGTAAINADKLADGATNVVMLATERTKLSGLAAGSNPTPATVTLTDGATVALDAAAGKVFKLTAAGNRTISNPTNAVDGRGIIIAHTASGAGRTLALSTGSSGAFIFGTDITALTATTSGLTDYIGAIYDSTAARWKVISYVKGF